MKIPNFLNYSKNLISFIQKNQKDFSDLDNTNDDDEFLQKRNDLLKNIENYFEKIIGNNKEYIEKEYIQKIFIEDYCKYFIISNLNIINKEDLDHCIYILNFFIRQEIKFFCKEETGLRKLIEIFAFLKRNPFIEIILILFKTFEKNKIKQIFQSIESEINAISNSIIDSYFEGEPFAQIFNLLFKFLCLNNFDEIKDDNFDNLLYFIGNIEKIKNIIKFSSSYMMNFRNILLIYNATKNYDNIKQYAEIGKNQNNSKDILNAQFSFIKNILKEKNKNEFIIEFLYNKLREDLENELTIEIFKKLIQQKDIDLILSSKEVIDSILKKTIFNDFTFDYNGDYHELINIINIIKESIENKNEFIQELNEILNNNENTEEKNIGESLKMVLINWFENIFYLYFQKLKVEEITEEQLDALINCLEDLNEINNKKLRDIFSVSYIKNILQFLIKSKSEYVNKMQNIDKYKKMILEKSNMEKTIKIYMNKIDYRIQGNNYNTITKENNFICDDFFDKIIIFNYKKRNEYISIIKKIGSINEDLNEEYFDSFFDIFLNFYANAENENRFSNNIKSIFQKTLKSKKLNEKQRNFYKNDFNDFIKNKTIINNEISTYIIKLCSLFLKEDNLEKIKNKNNEFFQFMIKCIKNFLNEEKINIDYMLNKIIKDLKFKNFYFLNIILKIENDSFTNFLDDFISNSNGYDSEIIDFNENISNFKNKIEEIVISDEIEPEQFEDKFINYKYFIYYDYPSLEGLKKYNNSNNYTLINFYIENSKKKSLNPIIVNNFETKILEYYNNIHFISKKYSKQKIYQVTSDFQEFNNDYERFKEYWNELYDNLQIEDEKQLECILNTNDKNNEYGNQIYKYYKNIIDNNNKYISYFIDCIEKKKLPKYWKKFLSEKKLIKNVFSEYNLFTFDEEKISADKNKNLNEILYNNSSLDIIYKNNKFYFEGCKAIKYNLSKIEKLLIQSILIGKSYFKDDQIFIEYNQFDPLSKNIFTDYNKHFNQRYLEISTKKSIKEILKKYENKENDKNEALKGIKKLMKLIKSNNLNANILEIPNKQFENIPKLLDEILQLKIKNECIFDLYQLIELSIIYDKFYNFEKKDKNLKNINLSSITTSILRKFYIRFVYNNEISKDLPIKQVIFENNDLFFRIPKSRENKEDFKSDLDQIKDDIKKLSNYNVNDCLNIYLNNISEDKELKDYAKLENKSDNNDNPPNNNVEKKVRKRKNN